MDEQSESREFAWGCVFGILTLIYSGVAIYAGYLGLEDAYGKVWAVSAIFVAFVLRISLPLAWGAFLCAKDIWGWHWTGAAVFAAPGLAFMALLIPGALASLFAKFRR